MPISSQYSLLLAFSLFLLGVSVFVQPSVAQEREPVTIETLRAIPLDSLDGVIPVYYSSGYRERAESLQHLFEAALTFYEDTLACELYARLAVLNEADWTILNPHHSYGFPWYIRHGVVPVVVMPATTDHGLVVDMLRPRLGDTMARKGVDAIGFHELGHIIAQEYLYPGDSLRTAPVHWFDEMMATYIGQGYLWLTDPDIFKRARRRRKAGKRATGNFRPPMTSLNDFEANYTGPWDGRNYGWYEGTFAARAAEIFEAQGLSFLWQVKGELPWDRLNEWTSDDLLNWLERIKPGFEAWAASLER